VDLCATPDERNRQPFNQQELTAMKVIVQASSVTVLVTTTNDEVIYSLGIPGRYEATLNLAALATGVTDLLKQVVAAGSQGATQ
jgi:hypothetical protein